MLSVSGVTAGQAAEYYSKDDYYFAGEHTGKGDVLLGAEALGKNTADAEDLRKLAEDRIRENNPQASAEELQGMVEEARVAIDATFSAPKSVSLLWAFGDRGLRQALEQAHQKAVKTTLEFMKESGMFQTRDEKGDLTAARPDSVVAVEVRHYTSRAHDPQLHSHVLISTTVERASDGKKTALEPREILLRQNDLGLIYRQELAREMEKLGFQVDWKTDEKHPTFEVRGFTQEQLERFSTRREEIQERLKELGLEGSARAAQAVALDTRNPKEEVSPEKIREEWEAKAREVGLDLSQIPRGQESSRPLDQDLGHIDRQFAVERALREQVLNAGYFTRHEAMIAASRALAQLGATADLKEVGERVEHALDTLKVEWGAVQRYGQDAVGREVKSFSQIAEVAIKAEATGLRSQAGPEFSGERLEEALSKALERFENEMGFKPSEEQVEVVRAMLGPGGDAVIVGQAGTGKTTTLRLAKLTADELGVKIMGTSFTGKAVDGLQQESGIASRTIDSLTIAAAKGKVDVAGGVIVMDEANMTDAVRFAAVQEIAASQNARIVYLGDLKQLQPVGMGDVFRGLLREATEKERLTVLSEIRRQKDPDLREAVKELAVHHTREGVERLAEQGRVHEVKSREELVSLTAQKYLASFREGKNTLAVASTNALVRALNERIRELAKEQGLIKSGREFQVRDQFGDRRIELAEGDRVLFLRNDTELGVRNGTLGTVKEVNEKGIVVQVGDRQVEVDLSSYKEVTHGHAVTVHKSEGMTVDRVYYAHEGKVSANAVYVAVSRAREDARVITTSVSELKAARSESKDDLTKYIEDRAREDQKLRSPAFERYQAVKEAWSEARESLRTLARGKEVQGEVFRKPLSKEEISKESARLEDLLARHGVKFDGKVLDREVEAHHARFREFEQKVKNGRRLQDEVFSRMREIRQERRELVERRDGIDAALKEAFRQGQEDKVKALLKSKKEVITELGMLKAETEGLEDRLLKGLGQKRELEKVRELRAEAEDIRERLNHLSKQFEDRMIDYRTYKTEQKPLLERFREIQVEKARTIAEGVKNWWGEIRQERREILEQARGLEERMREEVLKRLSGQEQEARKEWLREMQRMRDHDLGSKILLGQQKARAMYESWREMNDAQRKEVYLQGERSYEGVKEALGRGVSWAAEWRPSHERLSERDAHRFTVKRVQTEYFRYDSGSGKWKPTLRGYLRFGVSQARYRAALMNGEWRKAAEWGQLAYGNRTARYREQRINRDIAYYKSCRGEMKPDWKMAFRHGWDAVAYVKTKEAMREGGFKKAAAAALRHPGSPVLRYAWNEAARTKAQEAVREGSLKKAAAVALRHLDNPAGMRAVRQVIADKLHEAWKGLFRAAADWEHKKAMEMYEKNLNHAGERIEREAERVEKVMERKEEGIKEKGASFRELQDPEGPERGEQDRERDRDTIEPDGPGRVEAALYGHEGKTGEERDQESEREGPEKQESEQEAGQQQDQGMQQDQEMELD